MHIQTPATPTEAAALSANPVLVEVTRGDGVESRHRAAFAVVDTDGHVVFSAGDIERPVFPRSAVKPLQALAMVEAGACEAFALGDAEIALACASHSGTPAHVEVVESWLARIGCGDADLECGAHLPADAEAARALLAGGGAARQVHNNCSGKHAGFLTLARHLDCPAKGYIDFAHPVQQRVLGILEQMAGLDDLTAQPRGVDGCGIPTIAVPLGNLALAMARLADPDDQPGRRQAACARIRAAMAARPDLVAGPGRFCTEIISVTGERALVKTGAEGVYGAAFPELGLGAAVKVDDGAGRAASVVMGRLLRALDLLDAEARRRLSDILEPPVVNRAGIAVGTVRPVDDFPV